MFSNIVMTIFTIALATVLRDHFAFIYGMLIQRVIMVILSHCFYRNVGVGIAFDREALTDQFKFARFVFPSSVLTIASSQYDKLILVRLFNLALVGVYGIAGNMVGPIAGLVQHNARVVLYARCSDYFRTDKASACDRYYQENSRLLTIGVILPAVLAGFAQLVVALLYDPRYALAGVILMTLSLSAIIIASQNASENLLVAYGQTHTVLVINLFRLCTTVPATLLGYYLFGIYGFLWFNVAANIPLSFYLYGQQKRCGVLRLKSELGRLGIGFLVFLVCFTASHLALAFMPSEWMHLGLKRH